MYGHTRVESVSNITLNNIFLGPYITPHPHEAIHSTSGMHEGLVEEERIVLSTLPDTYLIKIINGCKTH